jgi:exodeoxyribonuclease VII large subunit
MGQEYINGVPLLTVSTLSRVVEKSISGIYPSGIWIEGEIAELKAKPHVSGHYFSLIEGADKQLRAIPMRLWKQSGSLDRITAKMTQLGIPLENGMRVRFFCKLNFYNLKGEFSLIVNDVDPQFTLGNIAAKRDQLIAKLVGQGLDKVNKKIAVPSIPLSLGVVSCVLWSISFCIFSCSCSFVNLFIFMLGKIIAPQTCR